MTIKTASPSTALPVPSKPKPEPMPSETIPPFVWALMIGFLIMFLILFSPHNAPELIVSGISLIWAIWVTAWIKKIKDRQTETVLVQTMSLEVLQGILDEIKKQNV